MQQAAFLEDRAAVALSGPETQSFLQGLITGDMERCHPGHALYAALLTPQGKILFDFFVAADGTRFLLDCAAARADGLIKRLSLYRLRAKIEIGPASDLAVAAIWNDDGSIPAIPGGEIVFPDPRLLALGLRLIGPRARLRQMTSRLPAGDYHAHRLALGAPDSADLGSDSVFALDAGLEELNGVSFKKGCYIGQEVTARMKHRATARRRLLIADISGPLPLPGTALTAQSRELGVLATGKGNRALALVRLDRLAEAEAADVPITAGEQIVALRKPGWLRI